MSANAKPGIRPTYSLVVKATSPSSPPTLFTKTYLIIDPSALNQQEEIQLDMTPRLLGRFYPAAPDCSW